MKPISYGIVALIVIIGAFYVFSAPAKAPVPVGQEQAQVTELAATTTSVSTTTESSSAKKVAVSVINFSFQPQTITINKGDTVVWTNNDSVPHQIAGGPLDGPVMSKGQGYSFTFNSIGTMNYHCAIHPSMTGTIIVQ